jgi:hypothetical protein
METNIKSQTLKYKIIGRAFSIFVILLLLSILFFIYKALIGLPKEILAPIIAAFGAIFVVIVSFFLTKFWERRKIIEQEQLKQKLQLYEDFIGFWVKDLMALKLEEPKKIQERSSQFFINFIPKLIIWGSDKFIKDYYDFLKIFTSSSEEDPIVIFQKMLIYEKLLYSIRQELGYKNQGLKETDLLSLFITDIRNMLSK